MSNAPIRIMLVDDHKTLLWGLEKLIESAGPGMRIVAKATSSDEALAQIATCQADVVLIDLDFSDVDGLELLSELRALCPARFIVLVGERDPKHHHQALAAGAAGLLLRSEPVESVLQAIVRVHAGQVWVQPATMAAALAAALASLGGVSNRTDCDEPCAVRLTSAERRIVAAVVRNKAMPNKAIARTLHISSHTLRNHLASIYSKLELHSRLDLVLYALENPLLAAECESPHSGLSGNRALPDSHRTH